MAIYRKDITKKKNIFLGIAQITFTRLPQFGQGQPLFLFLHILQNWDFYAPIPVDLSGRVNDKLETRPMQEKRSIYVFGLTKADPWRSGSGDWEEIQSISGTGYSSQLWLVTPTTVYH